MSGRLINTSEIDDNRAVAPVIGVVILFGFLILALSLYQVQVIPQQNAETEFQHSGEVRNDLVELRAAILQAGSIDQPQYQTVQLGTTYSTRTFTINPPSPAGSIRTTDPYPITISNNSGTPEGTITIPTRFVEYQPGYNELDRSPTWYDASVLYLDARDDGGGIAVIEDQALVDNGEVQITALQNEFRRSGTGQVTLELRPAERVTGEIPEGDLTVTVPTRLSEDDWETKTNLPTDSDVYDGVTDTGVDISNMNVYNLTLNTTANNLTVDTVGVQEAPEDPTQNADATIGGDRDGGGTKQCVVGRNINSNTLQIPNFQEFETKADGANNKWRLKQLKVQDNDGDNDLNQVKFEITDSSGTTRATKTIDISGQQYQLSGNIEFFPDDGSYTVQGGETYTLTATACDADKNSLTKQIDS